MSDDTEVTTEDDGNKDEQQERPRIQRRYRITVNTGSRGLSDAQESITVAFALILGGIILKRGWYGKFKTWLQG